MKRIFVVLLFLLGYFAVITQFKLMMDNRIASIPETIVRFFSFFTILTNILVALYFTLEVFKVENRWFNTRNKAQMLTAVTVYIAVVGLVYQVVLRQIWNPTGLQRLVDELLHSVIPVLAVVYWISFENKSSLKWNMIPKWLIYPLVYLVYVLIRGEASGFYPYPFVDVATHGLQQVLINSAFVTLLFVAISCVLVGIGKRMRTTTSG